MLCIINSLYIILLDFIIIDALLYIKMINKYGKVVVNRDECEEVLIANF